jgi:nitric oxide reductase subunit B
MSTNTLKIAAIVCFVVAMGGLLLGGLFANREAPPYPARITGPEGTTLFTKADILAGQDVYQRYGLMDHGSVWGHGSQRGMEFSAVTLHRIGSRVRDDISNTVYARPYALLSEEERDLVGLRTQRLMKPIPTTPLRVLSGWLRARLRRWQILRNSGSAHSARARVIMDSFQGPFPHRKSGNR